MWLQRRCASGWVAIRLRPPDDFDLGLVAKAFREDLEPLVRE